MWNHIAIIGYNNDIVFCVAENGEPTSLIVTNILDVTSIFPNEFPININHVLIASYYYNRVEYACISPCSRNTCSFISDKDSFIEEYTPIEIYELFKTMTKTPYIKVIDPHLQTFKIFTWGNTISPASLQLYNNTLEKYSYDYFLSNT